MYAFCVGFFSSYAQTIAVANNKNVMRERKKNVVRENTKMNNLLKLSLTLGEPAQHQYNDFIY